MLQKILTIVIPLIIGVSGTFFYAETQKGCEMLPDAPPAVVAPSEPVTE